MQFASGIKRDPAIRTTALTILLSGQQLPAVSAKHRKFLFCACGRKGVILHFIMTGKAGIVFPAPGTFEGHHVTVLMIMSTPALFVQIDTIYLNLCMHIFLSSYLQHIFFLRPHQQLIRPVLNSQLYSILAQLSSFLFVNHNNL